MSQNHPEKRAGQDLQLATLKADQNVEQETNKYKLKQRYDNRIQKNAENTNILKCQKNTTKVKKTSYE